MCPLITFGFQKIYHYKYEKRFQKIIITILHCV